MNRYFGSRKEPDVSAAASKNDENIGKIMLSLSLKAFLISLAIVFSFLLIVGSAAAGLLGGGIYGIIKTTPMVDAELFKTMGFNSYVYDADGNIIAELKREENRVWIDYEDIPKILIDAFIAVEDKRFNEHKGIDFRRIGSAVLTYGKKLLGADVDIEGGSTITQQLIKNLTKRDDITIPRKLQEQWQAIELEKVLTKEEILAYYLNNIPMGGNFYGIETAAKGYFGKDVRDLSLAECASLAGITNWPTKYMPIDEDNIEANLARTKTTLGLMLEQGKISQSEYDEALNEKIAFQYNPEAGKVMKTSNQSYFVDEVVKSLKYYLMQTGGYTEQAALDIIYNNGLHIYSSMDPKIQNALDEVFTDSKYFSYDNKYTDELPQAAMVIMGKDGFVKGVYGGRGAKEGSVFNRATQAERPPGSAIKPILIYGPGIDSKALTAATVVDDVKQYLLHNKPNQEWPRNVEKSNFGLTTARIGVFKSRNVVATLLLKDYVGLDAALDYLGKLGIDRQNEQYLSIAMGGFNKGMTPLEMAAAFAPFANKGVYTKPMFFTEVKDNNGKTIISVKPERRQVFSEQTVFIMDNILQDVVTKGTAYPEGIVEYKDAEGKKVTIPSAGKTGTTDSDKDKWFCGFTPYYVGVSWYGYDRAVEIQKEEKDNALLIWNAVMNKIHEGMPAIPFFESMPPNIVKRTICIDSGKIATDLCKKDPRGGRVREEYFIAGTEPAYSDTCAVHVEYTACTASKDAQNRDLLATEYCPFETLVQKIGIKRPVEYKPKFPNDSYPADSIYEIPEGEFCTVHDHGVLIPPLTEEIYPPESEIDEEDLPEGIPGGPSAEDIGDPLEEEDWEGIDWGEGTNNYD
ncbi:MAG: transglycosylase domain-containing protein [Acetivibrionales bacterium]|jgi:penicillin-binding protein 1A